MLVSTCLIPVSVFQLFPDSGWEERRFNSPLWNMLQHVAEAVGWETSSVSRRFWNICLSFPKSKPSALKNI